MPLFTTYQDFTGAISLPLVSTSSSPERLLLDAAIEKYESELFRSVFGVVMYDLFVLGVEDLSGIWYDLLNGKTYTDDDGVSHYWIGLEANNPAAYYVYFMRQRDMASSTTGIGVQRSKSENMVMINPSDKMVDAWNYMVDILSMMHHFLINNEDSYSDYIGLEYDPYWKYDTTHTRHTGIANYRFFEKINAFGI